MKRIVLLSAIVAWLILPLHACNSAQGSSLSPKERQKVSEILKKYGEYSEKSAPYGIWTAYRDHFDGKEYVWGVHTISMTANELLDTFEVFSSTPDPGYYCKYADDHQNGLVQGKAYQLVEDDYGDKQVKWDSKTEWNIYYREGGLVYEGDEFVDEYKLVKQFHDPVDSLLNDLYGGKYVFSEHLAPYLDQNSGKYGFVDEYLDVVIEAQFDSVGAFKNKTAIVYSNGMPDFVAHSGHLLKSDLKGCWRSFSFEGGESDYIQVIDFQKMTVKTRYHGYFDNYLRLDETPIKKITTEAIICGSNNLPICFEDGMFKLPGATHYSTLSEMALASGYNRYTREDGRQYILFHNDDNGNWEAIVANSGNDGGLSFTYDDYRKVEFADDYFIVGTARFEIIDFWNTADGYFLRDSEGHRYTKGLPESIDRTKASYEIFSDWDGCKQRMKNNSND